MIYISGPLTNADSAMQSANIEQALHVYKQLVLARCLAYCPHLSAFVPGAFEMDYKLWLSLDLAIIDRGSIVTSMLMIHGWETSRGAKEELALAIRRHLPIFTRTQAAIDHYLATYGPTPL